MQRYQEDSKGIRGNKILSDEELNIVASSNIMNWANTSGIRKVS